MKQKDDELPDDWVRQTLSRLPDAPPPGSSFDSERLWGQLRPELQPKPAHRQAWWWLSAACVAGLVIGWVAWPLPNGEQKPGSTTRVATHRPKANTSTEPSPKPIETIPQYTPALAETHQQKKQRNIVDRQRLCRPDDVATAPIAPEPERITQSLEPTTTPAVVTAPVPRKANIAAATPKRRFRVMHENELRAEDEAAPQLYRINHFVRLGSGRRDDESSADRQRTDNGSANRPPALTMPLNN